jgi:hypothetical protein
MAGVRIRWRRVARVAAIVVVGLIALRLVPGLLRAPEPPPLGADVGLPKVEPVAKKPEPVVPKPAARRRRKARPHRRPAILDAPAATAVIGTRHRLRRHRKTPEPNHRPAQPVSEPPETVESAPPPAPEYVPPPSPEPAPTPLPAAPPASPSTPDDGSEEFAPH